MDPSLMHISQEKASQCPPHKSQQAWALDVTRDHDMLFMRFLAPVIDRIVILPKLLHYYPQELLQKHWQENCQDPVYNRCTGAPVSTEASLGT